MKKAIESSEGDSGNYLKSFLNCIETEQRKRLEPRGSFLANLTGEIGYRDREIHDLIAKQYDMIGKEISRLLKLGGINQTAEDLRRLALFVISLIEGSVLIAKSDDDFWEMKNSFSMITHVYDSLR